jgi:hypothetical protein
LRVVLSGQTAAVSAQSSFGRRTVWVGNRYPIELIFGQYVGNSYVYLSTKFRAIWVCGLRAVRRLLKRTETVISLLCCISPLVFVVVVAGGQRGDVCCNL